MRPGLLIRYEYCIDVSNLHLISPIYRKYDRKESALPHLTIHSNPSVVPTNDIIDGCKAEAQTIPLCFGAVERFKDMGKVFL